jgi:dihydroxyacetone kinase-like protein
MFNIDQFADLFSLLRERFDDQLGELNALDSAVGDGDHGFTMSRTMRAAEIASRGEFPDLGAGFDAVAEAIAENAGGAIGPLLASLFAEGGLVYRGKQQAGFDEFCAFFSGGLAAVREVGLAQPGDKTLVDALDSAVNALKNIDYEPLSVGLQVAARAAREGAESTTEMTAVRGRARYAAERSRGHQDAGATSLALIIQTMADFMEGTRHKKSIDESKTVFTPPPGKIINHPDDMVREDNQGLALLYPDLIRLTPEGILARSKPKDSGKVGLVIGHGGGHTPSMGGFIGPGLLDADVYGPIFTCASGISIAQAIQEGDRGSGVVLLISNHSGDVLNARLAIRRAKHDGIQVEPIILSDDIATAPRERFLERRGLGGLIFALKIGGAAAEEGNSLLEVATLMRNTNQRTGTLSVAVKPPTHPATGEPLFEIPLGEIEIGTGVHGEIGVYRGPHLTADEVIDLLLQRLLDDLEDFKCYEYLVFINGAGGTSKMELHILYQSVVHQLGLRGLNVAAGIADSLFTTGEMGGFSLSLCAVDPKMLRFWDMPASAPSFRWPYA